MYRRCGLCESWMHCIGSLMFLKYLTWSLLWNHGRRQEIFGAKLSSKPRQSLSLARSLRKPSSVKAARVLTSNDDVFQDSCLVSTLDSPVRNGKHVERWVEECVHEVCSVSSLVYGLEFSTFSLLTSAIPKRSGDCVSFCCCLDFFTNSGLSVTRLWETFRRPPSCSMYSITRADWEGPIGKKYHKIYSIMLTTGLGSNSHCPKPHLMASFSCRSLILHPLWTVPGQRHHPRQMLKENLHVAHSKPKVKHVSGVSLYKQRVSTGTLATFWRPRGYALHSGSVPLATPWQRPSVSGHHKLSNLRVHGYCNYPWTMLLFWCTLSTLVRRNSINPDHDSQLGRGCDVIFY